MDEKEICDLYINENYGIEYIAKKFKVGKLKIKKILKENSIPIKKRGGQKIEKDYKVKDWRIQKYKDCSGYHYIAVDEKTGYVTNDYMNKGGFLTTHIKNTYNIAIPSLHDRRKYYMETGDYWCEKYFTIQKVKNEKVKKCPYCSWETIDVDNVSGSFQQHILTEHKDISVKEHLKKYPEDLIFFKEFKRKLKREKEFRNNDAYVVCPICNRKYKKLTESHMNHYHNMSLYEFTKKYPNTSLMSVNELKQINEVQNLTNLHVTKNRFVSSYEKEIQDFLRKYNIDFEPNRQILIGKEIDILIEDKKIGIEFDGLKFHTEFFGKKDHNYHLNKTLKCNEKGYGLIHIFEDEFVNNKTIVFEKLKHILHIRDNKEKIFARKCTIKEILKHDANVFLDKYHIQGFSSSTVYLGGFYNDKLIAVMTFKNGNIKNRGWELSRFATDYHYIINGIGGKLFKHFLRNYEPKSVYSFADRRWTVNIYDNLYTKLGFEIERINKPDYTYYNASVDKYKRIHKMRFMKSKLQKEYGFPMTMTEIEMAKELGYDRIWNCGLVKYIYRSEERK